MSYKKWPHQSLAAKLIITITLLILIGGSAYWFTYIQAEKANSMHDALSYVATLSDVIKKSISHDMLTVSRDDIQKTIESVATSESIDMVRILDHTGRVIYTSARKDLGLRMAKDATPCFGCHDNLASPQQILHHEKKWEIYQKDGQRMIAFVEPIYNEPACNTAACHAHPEDQKVLGILLTDFSLHLIDSRITDHLLSGSLYVVIFVFMISLILSYILWQIVLHPVSKLSNGMKLLSSGTLPPKMDIPSEDEIGMLARTFNLMIEELHSARDKMEQWTQSLEQEIDKKTKEINRAQDKLVEAEKLAALGRLTADIAHEIRNPLTAIGGFGRRLQKSSSPEKQKIYADILVSETDRLERVLSDVLIYSRDDRFKFKKMPINQVLDNSLRVFTDVCQEHSILVEKTFNAPLPVMIEKDQIMQAANNLISNAIDAMPKGGTLTVVTDVERIHNVDFVATRFIDTGPGIPAEQMNRVFDPFFTTKKIGQGTGLGLAITRKIIEEHGGFIKAHKSNGGQAVSLYIPYQDDTDLANIPCWEYMDCKRDVNNEIKCKAYPYFGRVCWVVAGTRCHGKIQGTFAQKYQDCQQCRFHKNVNGGQA